MWRKSLLFSLAVASASGQAPDKRLSFEVASVRRARDPGDPAFTAGIQIRGGSVMARRASLGLLIRAGYGLRARFLSAPDWVESGPTFDIQATLPSGAPPRLVPEMFQSFLEDRFKLKFHLEVRDRAVYALVLAKGGPKLQPSSSVDESMLSGAVAGIHVFSDLPGGPVWTSPSGSSYRFRVLPDGSGELSLSGASVEEFAYHLNTLDGLDIVDMTELRGKYNFSWTATREEMCELCPEISRGPSPAPTPKEKESLRKLGLRLEKRKASVHVFLVDRVEKTPTEN